MTYDQGKVMAGHQQLTAETGIAAYFADPHNPWQRSITLRFLHLGIETTQR